MGCCQTTIPRDMSFYDVTFDRGFNTSQIWNFSPCSYAVLMEAETFNFSTAYISTAKFNDRNAGRVPVVLDWAIRNGEMSCEVAKRNEKAYASLSDNSECVVPPNGPGYLCNCSKGYEGNPYLLHGCHDIDECSRNPCPSVLTVGFLGHLIFSFFGSMILQRRKLNQVKREHFLQHGGTLLFEKMRSERGIAFIVCTEVELIQATNNYDKSRVIGKGGHGTVYKGIVKGNIPVAIKRTLLRIAHKAAEGLNFLHSCASPPIIHGDVKTANVLLGENYMAKVSDFGASILAPSDEEQYVTMGQDGPDMQRSLSSNFLSAMKENNLDAVLPSHIKGQESTGLIRGLAKLAKQCLDMCGSSNRPSMKEIADELERLRKLSLHPWADNRESKPSRWNINC
ncbi:hypothetical protein U9M48_033192 [Paspalum notatum var. saurae]|uniref:Protein kinase domain-containing protein n=1 Tax=Paspalum notatum var. saurae TaxID=547442 RepID=A0AAQ3X628_PASNO